MEDFNKADIDSLPDLSGEDGNIAAPVVEEGGNPETPPNPEEGGEQPTEGSGESTEGGEGNPPDNPTNENPEGDNKPEGQQDQPPAGDPPSNTDYLSEMSDGRISSEDQLKGLLSHYEELVEATKNPELLIPEGKAREAYKYAMQFPGDNVAEANKNFHHVMSLDPEKLAPKELQFEAYLLRDENADLIADPKRARELFEAEYEAVFGDGEDLEGDVVLHRKHELATKKAAQEIEAIQTRFQSETTEGQQQAGLTPEEEAAYNRSLDEALNDMGGLTIQFEDNDEGMNFVLNDEQKQADFQHYVRNPGEWLQDFVSRHIDEEGNLNAESLGQEMMFAMFAKDIASLSYQQGLNDAEIKREEELRNAGAEGDPGRTPNPEEQTFHDAWANAEGMS